MKTTPFSQLLAVADVGPEGRRIQLAADQAQRETIARDLDLEAVLELQADVHVTVSRSGAVRVRGGLRATVRQNCVVTLEPVESGVSENIDVMLVPAGDGAVTGDGDRDDPPDLYTEGVVDLGAIIVEHLALGIDPYPKVPGAEFSPHIESDGAVEDSPFAVLKRRQPGGGA